MNGLNACASVNSHKSNPMCFFLSVILPVAVLVLAIVISKYLTRKRVEKWARNKAYRLHHIERQEGKIFRAFLIWPDGNSGDYLAVCNEDGVQIGAALSYYDYFMNDFKILMTL